MNKAATSSRSQQCTEEHNGAVQYMLLIPFLHAAFTALQKILAATPESLEAKDKLSILQQILKQVPGLCRQVASLSLTWPFSIKML